MMLNFLTVLSKVKKFVHDVLHVLPIVRFDISAPLARAASFLLPESSCTLLSPCFTAMVSKLKCITALRAGKKSKDRFVLTIKRNRKHKYKDLGII